MRVRRYLTVLTLPIAATLVGCAARGPQGRFGGSTVGRNLHDAPRGRVIPAAGLGVDLVDSHPQVDDGLTTASAEED
jgi:hypothetical protein